MQTKSAILWTGGKDSCLALYEAQKAGHKIDCLITFTPSNPVFLAHPIHFMKHQAQALNLPHRIIEIKEPYSNGYKETFILLREKHNITTLFTGDIDEIDGHSNWVKEKSRYANIDIQTPLWGLNRLEVLKCLLKNKFKIIFSCVNKNFFTDEWIGKEITEETLSELNEIKQLKGIDICGENGEYHTLVCDTPFFQQSIFINSFSMSEKNDLMYINIHEMFLKDKLHKAIRQNVTDKQSNSLQNKNKQLR